MKPPTDFKKKFIENRVKRFIDFETEKQKKDLFKSIQNLISNKIFVREDIKDVFDQILENLFDQEAEIFEKLRNANLEEELKKSYQEIAENLFMEEFGMNDKTTVH